MSLWGSGDFEVSDEMLTVLQLARKASCGSDGSADNAPASDDGQGSEKPTASVESSRPVRPVKRTQISYDEKTKRKVVYNVLEKGQSKMTMHRATGVPESTIRGWVKFVAWHLETAEAEGRNLKLTLDGFVENGVPINLKIGSAIPDPGKPVASPSRQSRPGRKRKASESAWQYKDVDDNVDAASNASIPGPASWSRDYAMSSATSGLAASSPAPADAYIKPEPVDIIDAVNPMQILDQWMKSSCAYILMLKETGNLYLAHDFGLTYQASFIRALASTSVEQPNSEIYNKSDDA